MSSGTRTRTPSRPRSRAARPRLRARLREATSAVILDAAEAVLAKSGSTTGMNAIAAAAGVSVGTLYNHFRDRDELVRALFAARRAAFIAAIDAAHAQVSDAPFVAQLQAFVRATLGWFHQNRDYARLVMEGELHSPRDDGRAKAMRSIHERLNRVIVRGVAEGVLDPDRSALYAAILGGVVKGVMANLLVMAPDRAAAQVDDIVATVVDTFLHGVTRKAGRR